RRASCPALCAAGQDARRWRAGRPPTKRLCDNPLVLHSLPWALVALALFVLAGVIFTRQRASRVAVLFCTMIVLVGAWFSAFAVMFSTDHRGTAETWARVALAAVCLLPAAIYDFTATALRLYSARRKLILGTWIVGVAFSMATAFTDGLVGGMKLHHWGFYPTPGPLMTPFL